MDRAIFAGFPNFLWSTELWSPWLVAGSSTLPALDSWGGLAIALIALAAMEIVLGIDNVIFISITTSQLPAEQQSRARLIGLSLAMIFRIVLLCFIATIASWTEPIFRLDQLLPSGFFAWSMPADSINEISVRDLILLGGGLFLIYQSVREIFHLTEGNQEVEGQPRRASKAFAAVLVQIALLDIVFSLDSVITAVGMVDSIPIMIAAVMIAVLVMMVFSGPVSAFVMKHPSVKVLALAFLLMIGVTLVGEGFGAHFNKNTIYFAMAFALGVELINLRVGRKSFATVESGLQVAGPAAQRLPL